ncbi:Zn-dependent exopeptidase [Sporormia fimetaria CBS 119925]|uniref:Carboxypeptidase M14B n=1 Tax=Sporormia fimetaria CBS 119925 TaxID=1340428 RepID=A0A6A6UV02_9PLEO|nr:Zn-dependent exopeptidase [Sporormia fimetaria CBS 119925]
MATSQLKLALFAALTTGVVGQSTYGENHVRVSKDSDMLVQTAFPEPNVTLYSPAFSRNAEFDPGWFEGTEGATQESTLDSFLRGLARKNDRWFKYDKTDFVSEEGRAFPYAYLSTSRRSHRESSGKLKVWLQGSVHGNEPAGDEALLALLGAMDKDPKWAQSFLDKMDILVLPRYNPDGNEYFQRTLATNFDPNRDHTKLRRQQTRDIKKFFNEFNPHIVVDMHEYGAATRYAGNYTNAADGMYSAAKNLNINKSIRELSENIFAPAINASLASKNLRGEPYVTASRTSPVPRLNEAGTDAKIGRNAMGLTQTVVFLFETRGIGLANQSFGRRTLAGLQMVLGVLETARDKSRDVLSTIEQGRRSFISGKEEIVVTDYTEYSERTYTFADRRNGDVVQLPVEFASTTPASANLTRARPEAYIIPRAWFDLAERLRVSGLEVETLRDGFKGQVEAYNITSISLADSYYEGEILNTVTTETITQEVDLPKGSFLVKTAQKNAALAFIALEPENIDSYVSFGVVPMEAVGDIYPVFRKV